MGILFQVVKKLAGTAHEPAAWATNVGNEHGQVLIYVLTTEEGKDATRQPTDFTC